MTQRVLPKGNSDFDHWIGECMKSFILYRDDKYSFASRTGLASQESKWKVMYDELEVELKPLVESKLFKVLRDDET